MTERSKALNTAPWLDQMEVVYRRPEGLVGFVPLELIQREPTAVDLGHVRILAESIRELRTGVAAVTDLEAYPGVRTGQFSPIALAEDLNSEKALITDGYHRVPALEEEDVDMAFATVYPNATIEVITDLRIISAVTHQAVKFARVASQVEVAWGLTQWSRDGLKSSQAFYLVADPKLKEGRHGLDWREIEKIREWVERKCKQWKLSPAVIYNYLRIARLADPDLVQRVRGGDDSTLGTKQLSIIVQKLPGRYDMQWFVADLLEREEFTAPELTALAASLVRAVDLSSAHEIYASGSWRRLVPVYKPTSQQGFKMPSSEQKTATEERKNMNLILQRFLDMALEEGRLTIENAQLKGTYTHATVEALQQQEEREEPVEEWTAKLNDSSVAEEDLGSWTDADIALFLGQIEILRPRLESFAIKTLGILPRDKADVIQDAGLKVLKALKEGGLKYRTERDEEWMKKVIVRATRQAAIDFKRKKSGRNNRRPPEISIDRHIPGGDEIRTGYLPGMEERGYQEVEGEETNLSTMLRILPALGQNERKIFVLHTFYGLKDGEIAQMLGVTSDTVASTLSHVRVKIDKINHVFK